MVTDTHPQDPGTRRAETLTLWASPSQFSCAGHLCLSRMMGAIHSGFRRPVSYLGVSLGVPRKAEKTPWES